MNYFVKMKVRNIQLNDGGSSSVTLSQSNANPAGGEVPTNVTINCATEVAQQFSAAIGQDVEVTFAS